MSDNKFISFLKHVGRDFKKGLGVVLPIADAVATGLSVVNPALGGLLHTSILTVMSVEQKFTAEGQQDGSGPQKLAEAVNILYPAFKTSFAQYGVQVDTNHVENYINAIVAALNAFPHVDVTAPPATPGQTS